MLIMYFWWRSVCCRLESLPLWAQAIFCGFIIPSSEIHLSKYHEAIYGIVMV